MKMRLVVLLPLLAAAVNARPQTSTSKPSSDWKPVINETETQRLRAENQETRTYRIAANPTIEESVQKLTNQLTKSNRTQDFTMDTRTPPRIKFQQKNMERKKLESTENSHPGVAIPIVNVDEFYESTTQKKPVKSSENKTPTTDSGISTWILLSGQSTTLKPVRKLPTIKTTAEVNKTLTTEKPVKTTIKIKSLTTTKPKTTTTEVTKIQTTTENTRLMTKVKASLLNNAVKNKTITTTAPTTTKINSTISENTEGNDLRPEAKDGTLDLSEKSNVTTKRPRRPTNNNKRKKNNNKNRRRKPTNTTASEKMDTAVGNSTIIKPIKDKPIGTQIYNYLSREIMPTVGVGLVGLMVTAGLASYFFYPFTGLRRTFDSATDRKDYYYDEYAAGGMAEEELIGKVIAGMPEHTNYPSNNYRTHLARNDAYKNDINYNYRNSDTYYPQPNNNDYQTVSVGSKIGYGRDVIEEQQKETGYTVDDSNLEKNQFVVGSIPQEFEPVSPDAVPEHGPRSLRIRRYIENEDENEIINFKYETIKNKMKPTVQPYTQKDTSTDFTISESSTTTESTVILQPEQPNFFSFLRNLIELKVRLGLDLLLRTTDSFSNYLRGVQERVNSALREETIRTPSTS